MLVIFIVLYHIIVIILKKRRIEMRTAKLLLVLVCVMSVGSVFASGKEWLTDFDAAKKEAAKRNLPILVDFSGSDWCKWCMKLDKEVFSQKAFKDYVKDNFILLLIDFPNPRTSKQSDAEKKQNRELAQKYKVRGFPTVLILDKDGKLLKSGGYMEGGPEAYIKYLKQVKSELK
jgi:protein disulfide-isomerase